LSKEHFVFNLFRFFDKVKDEVGDQVKHKSAAGLESLGRVSIRVFFLLLGSPPRWAEAEAALEQVIEQAL
jgi:hypothetical protein